MAYVPAFSVYSGHTTTSVTSSAAPGVVLLGQNPERKSFYVFNDSPNTLFLNFSSSVSSQAYVVQLPSLTLYESAVPCPTGSVCGVWSAASGSAKVTDVF